MDTVETTNPIVIPLSIFPDAGVLKSVCELVPTRDTLALTFRTDSGDILRVTSDQPIIADFSKFFQGITSDECIEVNICIDKTVSENRFSIYDYSSFTEDLLNRPIVDIFEWFSGNLLSQEYLVFEVFDSSISFSTGTMAFISSNVVSFSPLTDRGRRLRACKETANFYNMSALEVIPDDFIVVGIDHSENYLRALFGKLATILSLVYSATSSSILDTVLSLQINGLRTMSYELRLADIQENAKWISIYSWIYTDGNPIDKALIAQNVISLHCKYAPLLGIDEKAVESIKSNYKLYLRSNVGKYLDLKRDISKYIQSVVTQVGDYAVSILSKFKTNLIAIFGFLFTVVLTRVGATQKWEDIFTRHTIYLIEIVLIGSLGYLVICIFEARYKLRKTKLAYTELKNNYSEVLSVEELKEAFGEDTLIKDTEKSVIKGMIGWSIVWGAILLAGITIVEVLTKDKGVLVWLWSKVF